MTTSNHTRTRELSYYGLSLRSFLITSHPDRAGDRVFIEQRVEVALAAYTETIRSGRTHPEAEHAASEQLYMGLHFSPYDTLVNILWDEFPSTVPGDEARRVALQLLPLCGNVLAKYVLTDDFADTPQYDRFYTELVGTVEILLEDGI